VAGVSAAGVVNPDPIAEGAADESADNGEMLVLILGKVVDVDVDGSFNTATAAARLSTAACC
jgi:hypothetical protein